MSPPTSIGPNIAKAIVSVMSEIGSLAKDGRNEFSKYSFTSEALVINTLRPLLVKNGLALIPGHISVTSERDIHEKMRRVAISATYLLIHESGEVLPITVPGEGMDSLDKSTAKALTGALKYALLQTFCVGRGEDGDEGKGYDVPERENEAVRAASRPETPAIGVLVPFGDYKDKPLSVVPNKDLQSIMAYVEKSLKDPAKKNYAGKNKLLLDGILGELNRRARNASTPTEEDLLDEAPF